MRLLIISMVFAVPPATAAFAQEPFGRWGIFPGPNPEASDLLPAADTESVFRIGHVLFEYPEELDVEQPVEDVSDLPSVEAVVKAAEAHPALDALVQQQLMLPHRFALQEAKVSRRGDAGLVWQVTHALYPAQGGFSGVPYRYRTVADGRGKIIPPERTVFDAFFHSGKEGWTCSTLRLSSSPPEADPSLTEAAVQDRATKQLEAFGERLKDSGGSAFNKRMRYSNQQKVRIPVAADPAGVLVFQELWAVNFVDTELVRETDQVFTVWVAADGHVAQLRHLDRDLNPDEDVAQP